MPITLAENNEPYVTYTYLNTAGLSDKYSYTEFDMGSAGTVHINNFSGNMILTRDDISTTGESYSYDLTSAYNSKTVYEEEYPCWVRSYEAGFLTIMMYIDEYGTLNFYNGTASETESNTYILEENDQSFEKMTVTDFATNTITLPFVGDFVIRIPIAFDVWSNDNTEKSHYTMAGLFSKMIDIDESGTGKTVFSRAYDYDENGNKISGTFYIVDGDNDKLKIVTADSSCSVTQLDIKEDGTVIEEDTLLYIYDAQGLVSEIKYNGVTQGSFTYDDNGLMTSVTNNDGYRLDFTYNVTQRAITSVTESKNGVVGQKMELTRSYNKSIFRTSGADGIFNNTDDILTTYSFDTSANIVSAYATTVSGESLSSVDYEYDKTNKNLKGFGSISKVALSGMSVNNLIQNHNTESLNNWSVVKMDDNNCTHSSVVSSDKAYVGVNSLKHTVTNITTSGGVAFRQNFNSSDGIIKGGKTYTASTYINTSGLSRDVDVASSQNYGAAIMVSVTTSSGTTSYYSDYIQKTDSSINDGWERVFTTFAVPQNYTSVSVNLVLRNATGTAYYDGIQLEEGDAMNAYNMVENNGFTYMDSNNLPVGWTRYLCDASDCVQNGQLKVVGSNTLNKAPLQEISLKDATQSDEYIVSLYGKADSAPTIGEGSKKSFGMHVLVFYDGNTSVAESVTKVYKDFNYYDSGKQYLSSGFDLSHPTDSSKIPTKIRIVLRYYGQINTAYFDNISLIKTSNIRDLAEEVSENPEDVTVTESYTYNDDGTVATYTNEDGIVYTYSYDSLGNITSVLNSEGKGDTYTYCYYDTNNDSVNDDSDVSTETYEDGTVCTYVYDDDRNLITETIVEDGLTTVYTYNTSGQLITESETPGKTYTYSYDEHGNVTSKLDSDGNGDRYTYQYFDFNNNGEYDNYEVSYESLENGEENWYNYSDQGNLTRRVCKKNGSTTAYNYDSSGNQISVEHNGFSYNYSYDEFGNTTSVEVGSQPLVSYGYSSDKSKLASLTYGNGLTESYTFNAYGQTVSKTLTGRGTANYYYNSLGELLYEKDYVGGRNTYHKYDEDGNYLGVKVTTTADNVNNNVIYSSLSSFDNEGKEIKNTLFANGFTSNIWYNYDEDGLCTSSDLSSTRKINYTYDDEQRLVSRIMTTGTPVDETYSYADDGIVLSRTVTCGTNEETLSYTYDENYNITEIKKNGVLTQSYVYDADNQLVRENNLDLNKTVTYTYDGYGNILSKNEYAYTVGELGTVIDTVSYTYDTVWKDKLASYDGEEMVYDAIGNPTTYRGATLTWSGRQLMSYTKGDLNITYKYNADGLRTQKTVNGVVHDYGYDSENRLVYEKHGEEYEMFYRYDVDGRLFQVIRNMINNNNYKYYNYMTTNHFGDVVDLRDGNGTVYVKYNYDNWGKLISVTNANGVAYAANSNAHYMSIRYRGYIYDHDTGLYYLQSRYYDPETGRFLNADDVNFIGYSRENLSYNTFAYCENNPVNFSDYVGNFPNINKLFELLEKIISIIIILKDNVEDYTYYKDSYTKGKVYIIDSQVEDYVNSTKESVYVVDYRKDKDPNMRILSSYRIKNKKYQREIADILLEYNKKYPVNPSWKRTKDSIVDEWRFHNLAYNIGYKRKRTADTDLNNKDEGKGFFDFVGR